MVKSGDSLSSIAVAFKTSVETLTDLNALKGERILIGKHLQVPWPNNHLAAAQDLHVVTHDVLPGESLGTIAERYNSDSQCIRLLNRLPDDRIRRGQQLRIPTTGPQLEQTFFDEVVDSGDTLGRIARKHKLQSVLVRHLNPKLNWRNLKIGQLVKLLRWTEKPTKTSPVEGLIGELPARPMVRSVPAPVAPKAVAIPEGPAPLIVPLPGEPTVAP